MWVLAFLKENHGEVPTRRGAGYDVANINTVEGGGWGGEVGGSWGRGVDGNHSKSTPYLRQRYPLTFHP